VLAVPVAAVIPLRPSRQCPEAAAAAEVQDLRPYFSQVIWVRLKPIRLALALTAAMLVRARAERLVLLVVIPRSAVRPLRYKQHTVADVVLAVQLRLLLLAAVVRV
jgi:hypothetical protein